MRREKTSVSQEDYLKAIWEMLEENQIPISARLAEELDVTPPAVNAALKRMARDGHVKVQRAQIDRHDLHLGDVLPEDIAARAERLDIAAVLEVNAREAGRKGLLHPAPRDNR